MLRSHAAGSLRASDAGQQVTLAGWVARRRDHGGVIFIDLRDSTGIAQVVFRDADVLDGAHRLRAEYCVVVSGVIEVRPEGNANTDIATGDIEINATALAVLGESAALPFQLDEPAGEEARLRYRYLDMRRDGGPGDALRLRSRVNAAARSVLASHDFVEIETPTQDARKQESLCQRVDNRVRPCLLACCQQLASRGQSRSSPTENRELHHRLNRLSWGECKTSR